MAKVPEGWQDSLDLTNLPVGVGFDVLRDSTPTQGSAVTHYKVTGRLKEMIKVEGVIHFPSLKQVSDYGFIALLARTGLFCVYRDPFFGLPYKECHIVGVRLCDREADDRHYDKSGNPL